MTKRSSWTTTITFQVLAGSAALAALLSSLVGGAALAEGVRAPDLDPALVLDTPNPTVYRGQLGIGVPGIYFSNVPVQALSVTNAVAIDAGSSHALALTADGSVWAWGANEHGQVGVGRNSFAEITPARVASTQTFASIAAGYAQSIALDPHGRSWVWGGVFKTGNWSNGPVEPSYAPTEGGFDEKCKGKP